jgi:hypothetical protein
LCGFDARRLHNKLGNATMDAHRRNHPCGVIDIDLQGGVGPFGSNRFWGRSQSIRQRRLILIASSYPFLDVMWTMLVFFAWVIWFWLLITVFGDVFRRRDLSGWGKAAWIIFVIVLPYFGVFIYLIAEHDGMAERNEKQMQQSKAQMDDYVKSVASASDPAEQIAKGKKLLDEGAITATEFDTLKQKALAQAG